MLKAPTKCPICGKPTHAAVVKCNSCGTTVNNTFGFSVFDGLDEKQTEFVLAFIECEGSIKDMEKKFGISYPTVKSRLSDIRTALGLDRAKQYRKSVLEELKNGDIDVDTAVKMITNKEN